MIVTCRLGRAMLLGETVFIVYCLQMSVMASCTILKSPHCPRSSWEDPSIKLSIIRHALSISGNRLRSILYLHSISPRNRIRANLVPIPRPEEIWRRVRGSLIWMWITYPAGNEHLPACSKCCIYILFLVLGTEFGTYESVIGTY